MQMANLTDLIEYIPPEETLTRNKNLHCKNFVVTNSKPPWKPLASHGD